MHKYRAEIPSLPASDEDIFFNRRKFMQSLALGSISAASASRSLASARGQDLLEEPFQRPLIFPATRNPSYELPAGLDTSLTPRQVAASHNNFYEFLPGRGGAVWRYIDNFEAEPWKVEIKGRCRNPRTLDLDDLFKIPHEERLYHFRCVERWAMNVPWSGFPPASPDRGFRPESGCTVRPFRDRLSAFPDAGDQKGSLLSLALPRGPPSG